MARLPRLLLPLAFLLAGCSADDGARPGTPRDLLRLGPDQIGDDPHDVDAREYSAGELVLVAGEKATFHVELSGPAYLEARADLGEGRLVLDSRAFAPALGQATSIAEERLEGTTSESWTRFEIPDPESAALALTLTFEGKLARDETTIEELILRERDRPEVPPIVFLSVDTFSTNQMSLYGYERETTPVIDRLAETEAVTFREAYANGTWTTPSYASQFSGVYPSSLRVDPHEWSWAVPDGRWTLAEMLRARGYRTAAFMDNLNLGARHGLEQGFEYYDMSAADRTITDTEGGIRHVLSRSQEWMTDALGSGLPFFAFLQVVDLHAPYLSPPEFEGVFDSKDGLYEPDATLPIEAPLGVSFPVIDGAVPLYVAKNADFARASETRMYSAPLVTAYDDQIRALDASVGDLVKWLRDKGIWDDCVFLLSADHGETMLEHDVYFRHVHNYRENLRVPLVVRTPDSVAGTVVDTPVQLVDLMPTLAELVGLDPASHALHGQSLVAALNGGAVEPQPILGDTGVGNANSVYWKGWKLIESYPGRTDTRRRLSHRITRAWLEENHPELGGAVYGTLDWEPASEAVENPAKIVSAAQRFARSLGPYYELYHIETDPFETNNLAEEKPELVEGLLRVMNRLVKLGSLGRLTVMPDPDRPEDELSEEERAELEKLGY